MVHLVGHWWRLLALRARLRQDDIPAIVLKEGEVKILIQIQILNFLYEFGREARLPLVLRLLVVDALLAHALGPERAQPIG